MPSKPPAGMTREQADAAVTAAATVTFNHAPACDCTPADFGVVGDGSETDEQRMQAYTDHVAHKRYGVRAGVEPSECEAAGGA